MTPQDFIRKWSASNLSEGSGSQQHFLDLCELLGQPKPAAYDSDAAEYAFEKAVDTTGPASKGSKGARGFADVWWKDKFGWEYKRRGKHASLDDAHRQLKQYREGLLRPPLLIVSDIDRIIIHTDFNGYRSTSHTIHLQDLADPTSLDLLRRIFTDPESFKPSATIEQVTEDAAKSVGQIAVKMRARGHDPHDTAHFLMKCMFCLFAEDVELLPTKLFENLLHQHRNEPAELKLRMDDLFSCMRVGKYFGPVQIAHFNGGLFDEQAAIELNEEEIKPLRDAAAQSWADVEPSIFGTLFERSLDPEKRSQTGAHYTSREDIMLVIEPVITRPLRREFDKLQDDVASQLERRAKAKTKETKRKANDTIDDLIDAYQSRLSSVTVLDPACGSGNFLYVAIQQLLDLEKELITFAATVSTASLIPKVSPKQLKGIEINPYAAELAQVVIWIGYLQWLHHNGFNTIRKPILDTFDNIENRDAILQWQDSTGKHPPSYEPGATCKGQAPWPNADFIVGNPPFLGVRQFREQGMSDEYIDRLYETSPIPNASDLCCYWFDRAGEEINDGRSQRAGLLATQGIRGGANRATLKRLLDRVKFVEAWSDRKWILDGASVQISIVVMSALDNSEPMRLDGNQVTSINADLTTNLYLGNVRSLSENKVISFMGDTKGGAFDISPSVAREFLASPSVHEQSNLKAVIPWINGRDVNSRPRGFWIVDFGWDTSIAEASKFDAPFRYVENNVKPSRQRSRQTKEASTWWRHVRPRPDMRESLEPLSRFLFTCNTAKHRLFVWVKQPTLPDHAGIAFARSDDYFLGVLHAAPHELWALRQGTQLEDRPRYTPTTCFETFPLPFPPGSEPDESHPHRPLHDAIAAAAEALNTQRERWLNPPEWIEEVAAEVDAEDTFDDVAKVSGEHARQLIRQSAIDARAAKHPKLKRRTLTNLYNERPTWLQLAHETLDQAVINTYAHTHDNPPNEWNPTDWPALFKQTGPGQPLPDNHELTEARHNAEQAILENLLHLNHQRANNH